MKISEGFWASKKGYDVRYAAQAYQIKKTNQSIHVMVTTNVIKDRGMTLGGPNFEMIFSAAGPDVIKVQVVHFKGKRRKTLSFELDCQEEYVPQIKEDDESISLKAGDTSVVITKGDNWNISYYHKDKLLTSSGYRGLSLIQESALVTKQRLDSQLEEHFFNPVDLHTTYMREQLKTDVGECIYGFGEKFTPFVKNGQTVECWNNDGGTCTEQSYKNIPFYISSNGYGVLVNYTGKVSFEVNSDVVSQVSFTVPGESLEYFVIGGSNLENVMENYTTLTGKPALPPAETFGLWLSTSFTTDYDEKTVTSFLDGMKKRDIPVEVFHFDCFWMKEYEWCNFQWNQETFPEPQKMLKRLHDRGLKVCVWINPYISQHSELFEEGMQNGYFIEDENGDVFQTDGWQPGMAIVDFTNPKAYRWYFDLVQKVLKTGVDYIKTDFGERIPTRCHYYNEADGIEMHNLYTYFYNRCVFEAIESFHGKGQGCLFARSATVGGQKFPVHWGGDCYSEYSAMAETLRGGLSLCSSGFGFFSHDIGGFEAKATADVYKRWCAFGLLSTHSRLHGSSSYRVPWVYDKEGETEACDVLRHYVAWKGRLMPYLWAQAQKTHHTGIPMMRPMVMSFEEDAMTRHIDWQYMLGDDLCVVPVMNEKGKAFFYLPGYGKWTDIQSGKTYESGRSYTVLCDYYQMPVLARPNSIIVYGNYDVRKTPSFRYDYMDQAKVVIYELEDGKTIERAVYDADSNRIFTIKVSREKGRIYAIFTPVLKSFYLVTGGKEYEILPGESEKILNLSEQKTY